MSLIFSSTSTAAGLEQLNNYFAGNTYVFGHALSAADDALFKASPQSVDASKYPHFARYLSHIASYSAGERSKAAAIAGLSVSIGAATVAASGGAKGDDSDSGIGDIFGDDDDDESSEDPVAAAKAKAEAAKKAKAAAAKKSHKRPGIAKSRIVFEIKPYSVETDLEALAAKVKALKLEGEFWDEKLENCEDERCTLEAGCKWGEGHNLQPVAFGIFKLIIQVIVHDDLVGSDDLIELMEEKFADDIQSIDVAAFDKAS